MSITDLPVAERLPAMLAAGYEVRQNEYNDWARDLYQPGGVVYVGSVIANEIELARSLLALRARVAELEQAAQAYLNVATFSSWDAGDCRRCGGGAMNIDHSATCEYAQAENALHAALKGGDH